MPISICLIGELIHFTNNLHNYLIETMYTVPTSEGTIKEEIRHATSVDDTTLDTKYLQTLKDIAC